VAEAAQSTICKYCGHHIDLQDYRIASAMPKTIRTKGRLVIEERGFLFNTDSIAGEVILKGRLVGNIVAERSLELHSTAQIKGTCKTGLLIIPPGAIIHWPGVLAVGAAQIAGELMADLSVEGKVVLQTTARYFGQMRAADLAVESGAIFVGAARVNA
jgi:cytoskeletal protein CcmA (bactofilin family)